MPADRLRQGPCPSCGQLTDAPGPCTACMSGKPSWPAAVAALPRCPVRDLPVPYSSGRDEDGAGRFGVNDPIAKLACGLRRLCGVCGLALGGEIVFLIADSGRMHRPVFPDPPSHEECAAVSMSLCPHIRQQRTAGWLMWITGSYELVPGRRSVADFLPGPATRTRRFGYRDGKLREVTGDNPVPADLSGPQPGA